MQLFLDDVVQCVIIKMVHCMARVRLLREGAMSRRRMSTLYNLQLPTHYTFIHLVRKLCLCVYVYSTAMHQYKS